MKSIKLMPLLTAALLAVFLMGCGPSYVGARRAAGYGYGPGYYAPRPHYGFGYRPFRYRRAPIIVERRTYVTPRYRNNNRPSYAPNARSGGSYNNGNGYGGGGYRGGGSRGPR